MPNPNALRSILRDDTRRRFECVVADPSIPPAREFILQEVRRGTVRTVPLSRDRLLIVPTGVWPRGNGAHPD
jgi:hypothetical protein